MTEFIELTAVEKNGGHYDPASEKIRHNCCLKRLYVNPAYLVCIEENEALKKQIEREDIIPGLDPKLASFSTITLGNPSAYQKIDVVGKPTFILAMMRELTSGR